MATIIKKKKKYYLMKNSFVIYKSLVFYNTDIYYLKNFNIYSGISDKKKLSKIYIFLTFKFSLRVMWLTILKKN